MISIIFSSLMAFAVPPGCSDCLDKCESKKVCYSTCSSECSEQQIKDYEKAKKFEARVKSCGDCLRQGSWGKSRSDQDYLTCFAKCPRDPSSRVFSQFNDYVNKCNSESMKKVEAPKFFSKKCFKCMNNCPHSTRDLKECDEGCPESCSERELFWAVVVVDRMRRSCVMPTPKPPKEWYIKSNQ